ncbi:hypothetical protein HRbin40_00273 [bacterium HR40]|nr:hypothetical protein HRbin40_00273 [bacterium HR40]
MRGSWDPGAVLAELARSGGDCGTPPMRIDRDGRWWHEGRPIVRPELVRLFATALWRAADGRHWLLTPYERIPVEVEDTAFLVTGMSHEGEGRERTIWLRTNLGEEVVLDRDHPLRLRSRGDGAPVPVVVLDRGLEARVTRPVYYELAELALADGHERGLGVWSRGSFFPLADQEA